MASMERICPLSTPPPADYARMRWPQQMRQPREGDGMKFCPLRNGDGDDLKVLWDYEGPHALVWLLKRGDTVHLRPPGWHYLDPGEWYYDDEAGW